MNHLLLGRRADRIATGMTLPSDPTVAVVWQNIESQYNEIGVFW